MQVGVIGINTSSASTAIREEITTAMRRLFGVDVGVAGPLPYVLLITCNRAELYYCSNNLAQTHSWLLTLLGRFLSAEALQSLYSFFEGKCFFHLGRVASGLDSAILFETEIQGQVRTAYEHAKGRRFLPSPLHYLFQKALRIGKLTRTSFPPPAKLPDIEQAVLQIAERKLSSPRSAPLLVVGASGINTKIVRYLLDQGFSDITLTNRTEATAFALTKKLGIQWLPWEELFRWTVFDWVLTATKSTTPLFAAQDASRTELILDLGMPRNVAVEEDSPTTLYNIDDVQRLLHVRRSRLAGTNEQAIQMIREKTEDYHSRFHRKARVSRGRLELTPQCAF